MKKVFTWTNSIEVCDFCGDESCGFSIDPKDSIKYMCKGRRLQTLVKQIKDTFGSRDTKFKDLERIWENKLQKLLNDINSYTIENQSN